MAANQGTQVIAKIVTPDSADTFATHDANTGEGGFHQAATEAEMLVITVERRKAGMECRISNDPDPSKNGRYVLQNDLITWIKEKLDTSLGDPPDAGWGNGAEKTHALTTIATGDSTEERWDKVLSFLENIAPALPAALGTLSITIPNLWNANQQGEIGHEPINNIQTGIQPIGTLNGFFGDSKAGKVIAIIDGTDEGSRVLVAGIAGEDNGIYGALTLSAEEVFNGIYQRIQASILSNTPLALNNVKHIYRLEHDTEFTEIDFYIDDPVQPVISNEFVEGDYNSGVSFVSGVPTLQANDTLKTAFTAANVVSWYYNETKIARLESAYSNNLDAPLPAPPLNRGVSVNFNNLVTYVLDGVYTENTGVTVIVYNSRALTSVAQASDTSQKVAFGNIRIDTVSDETLTATSGKGEFPPVGAGSTGDPYNSSQDLNDPDSEELMMLNGIVQWPNGNFSGNKPTPGPNYNNVSGGSHNGFRWRTFDLGIIANQNSVFFEILNPINFNGTPMETGKYALMLQVEGATGWLDANAPYPGSGIPINDGDAALDVSQSTLAKKRITFGTKPQSGRVLVRIGWDKTENKSFTQIQY